MNLETTPTQPLSYTAHYKSGAATHYIVRNSISLAIWITLNIVLTNYFIGEWGFDRAIWLTIILLIPVLISITAIFTLKKRYTANNRLAIGVAETGLALPGRGVIAWDNIVGVRQGGTGVVTGNIKIFLFEAWAGTRETYSIQVFVKGGVDEIDKLAQAPNPNQTLINALGAGATRNEPHKGFRISTAYIQGLGDETYKQAVETVLGAAAAHDIPTKF